MYEMRIYDRYGLAYLFPVVDAAEAGGVLRSVLESLDEKEPPWERIEVRRA